MKTCKRLISVVVALVLIISMAAVFAVPASAVANGVGTYVITAASLNIRSTPSSSGTIIGSYVNGANVNVTSITGTWGKVGSGYVDLSYAGKTTSTTFSCSIKTNSSVNLRSGAGTSFGVLGTMSNGTKITMHNYGYYADGYWWWMIYVPSLSKYGFVAEDYIKF